MTPPRRAPQVFRPGFSDPGLHRLNQGAPGLDFQTWDTPSTPDKANHTTRVPQVWIFRPGILHQPLTKQITQPGCPRSRIFRPGILHQPLTKQIPKPGCPRSGFSDRGFHRPPRASACPSQHRNKANPLSDCVQLPPDPAQCYQRRNIPMRSACPNPRTDPAAAVLVSGNRWKLSPPPHGAFFPIPYAASTQHRPGHRQPGPYPSGTHTTPLFWVTSICTI